MFWGGIISEKQPLKSQKLLETSEFAVLHLSAAVLGSGKRSQVFAKNGKDAEVLIATVSEAREMAKLDLYINCTQAVTLSAKGGEVHLSGYFEPKGDDMDDDMFYGQEEDDDEEADDLEDDSEEETAPASKKKLAASLNQAKANSQKNAGRIMQADSDEESDLEDDGIPDSDDEQINMGAEEDSSDEEVPEVKPKGAKQVVPDSDEEDSDDIDDQLVGEDLSDDSDEVDLRAIMAKAEANKKAK